jgi:hypothetical protein
MNKKLFLADVEKIVGEFVVAKKKNYHLDKIRERVTTENLLNDSIQKSLDRSESLVFTRNTINNAIPVWKSLEIEEKEAKARERWEQKKKPRVTNISFLPSKRAGVSFTLGMIGDFSESENNYLVIRDSVESGSIDMISEEDSLSLLMPYSQDEIDASSQVGIYFSIHATRFNEVQEWLRQQKHKVTFNIEFPKCEYRGTSFAGELDILSNDGKTRNAKLRLYSNDVLVFPK